MKILSMTATFGCLDGEKLTLNDGVNLLTLPNESGKSTWSAFLTAMFYGIDTTERASAGRIPAKIKYQPWNGKPMEGLLELEQDGQVIVLQRTSRGNKPMSVFRAYDGQTGMELPELTGENCGEQLLGVERSVFLRSAFLCGTELAVTQEQSLSRRLENLAAGGDGQDSYPVAAERLKQWKNRCRYHQSGLLPQTQTQLEQVQRELNALADLRQRRLDATAQWGQSRERVAQLEQQERALWEENQRSAEQAVKETSAQVEKLTARTADLPTEDTLRQILARQAELDAMTEPPCPPTLEELETDKILPQAQTDLNRLLHLEKRKGTPWLVGAVVFALLAVVGLFLIHFSLVLLLPAMVCLILWLRTRKASRKETEDMLARYNITASEELLPVAMALRDFRFARESYRPEWDGNVREALDIYRNLSESRSQLERAELRRQMAQGEFRPSASLLREKEKASAWKAEADSLRMREDDRGGWDALQGRRQALETRMEELTVRERAMVLAQNALEQAHQSLTQTYAPQLTGLAGQTLARLTADRYDALVLQKGMELLVREKQSGLTRPLATLSKGTQDQVWLAMRLAMTHLLLPTGTLVILDDALLTFDDARTATALDVLAQENRQVLLFSCRKLQ